MTSKHLIVSADDYAASAAIDYGIIALIDAGRLSAASCMTCSPRWALAARHLTAAVRERCDLGLHLDFTQFSIQPVRKLSTLVILA